MPPKLHACMGFPYNVVHKIGRLRKFNRARGNEFKSVTTWNIFMKLCTLVHHAHGYKTLSQIFINFAQGLSYSLSKSKQQGKNIIKLWKIKTKSWNKFLKKYPRQRFVDLPFFFHSAKTFFVCGDSRLFRYHWFHGARPIVRLKHVEKRQRWVFFFCKATAKFGTTLSIQPHFRISVQAWQSNHISGYQYKLDNPTTFQIQNISTFILFTRLSNHSITAHSGVFHSYHRWQNDDIILNKNTLRDSDIPRLYASARASSFCGKCAFISSPSKSALYDLQLA